MSKWVRPSNIVLLIGLAGLVELVAGLYLQSPVCLAGGAVAICATFLSMRMHDDGWSSARSSAAHLNAPARPKPSKRSANDSSHGEPCRVEPTNSDALVEEMLEDGRFALLMRPQILGNLDARQLERTKDALDASMCLVPTGSVLLQYAENDPNGYDDDETGIEDRAVVGRVVHVDALFLDCHPVTNAQYKKFVDKGGYEQLAIWHEEALPALLDFLDQTGRPGPRFWQDGAYPDGEGDFPVVGVSWYEAWAFARWCGKRLVSDSEWVKAGAWPVESSPGQLTQRRFPWGNSFDVSRANIWGSGPERVVAVNQFNGGASVGGANQLIGNVWEWTSSSFGSADDRTLRLPKPMKAIRGGAFDTYFENQATCQFQSGEGPLARRHNIGFRLAIGVSDLAPEATGFVAEAPIHSATNDSPADGDVVRSGGFANARREGSSVLVEEAV